MTENAALLAAVAANPADDLPRLVYADWLDENGQPERAEFIRVQCELDRHTGTPRGRLLLQRQEELLAACGEDWQAGIPRNDPRCEVVYRRGFPTSLVLYADRLSEFHEPFARISATVRDVSVIGVRHYGRVLAECQFLDCVTTLRLEDWPSADDLGFVARSPHVPRLRRISWWVGGGQDEAVCRRLPIAHWLPQIDRIELVQLFGGLSADDQATDCDTRAERCKGTVNRARGVSVAVIHRPYDTLFPLPERIGRRLHCGRTSGDRQLLLEVVTDPYQQGVRTHRFDQSGRFVASDSLMLPWTERREVGPLGPEAVLAAVRKHLDFRPARIQIREFGNDWGVPQITLRKFSDDQVTFIGDPDSSPFDSVAERIGAIAWVRAALRGSTFHLQSGEEVHELGGDADQRGG